MKAERTGNGRIGWEGRLFRYISLLLIVAVLFSGVTFARYASMSEGSLTTGIARFDPSFTVDSVNSFTFGNSNYWQNYNEQWLEQGKGSARTVRISLHNDGEVDAMPAVIHMEGPAEFWENIALQLTTAKEDGSADMTLSTQYVFADLLRVRGEGNTVNGETHNFTYGDYIDWDNAETKTFSTSDSDNFDQRGDQLGNMKEETLQMSGGIVKTDENGIKTPGTVTAVRQVESSGYKMPLTLRITASMETVEYSVGFQRRDETANAALPALYLDCRKEVLYYSVDLILPDDATQNPFVVEPNNTDGTDDTSKGLVLFFTWTNSVSGEDFDFGIERGGDTASGGTTESQPEEDGFTWTDLRDFTSDTPLQFNGATVVGYHFNHLGVPCTQVVNNQTISGTTTVRINKRFNEDPDVTYSHVATLKEDEGQYPHALVQESPDGDYKCTGQHPVTISANAIGALEPDINVDDFVYQEIVGEGVMRVCSLATEKGYTLSFGVTFIQAAELPAGGTSTP